MGNRMQTFANCLRKIEVRYGADGFHGQEFVAPAVYSIHRDRDRLRPLRLEVADQYWQLGPPGEVLGAIADYLPQHPDRLLAPFRLLPEWVGMAVAAEAWFAAADESGWQELEEMAEQRLIRTHPNRESIRVVYGITREQERAMVWHREHGPGVEVFTDQNFPGSIQEGLAQLVGVIDELLD